ncbi:HAD family hydrolase [Alicyclobacillus sp.]|uniref:HAD family hydrolase n=1 Tax=Alicyclobacillus sp. TaxID=61169 RepID=UPI0025BC6C7B|nr:HAD family hydrolase [Alicyclobacillus sp.]MCL6515905.1 HAD hydrolase-like protein [Alicyclobacillus sp.]
MYSTILFDVDGVMLCEEHYFNASALTVWELLFSPRFLGLSPGALPAPSPDPDEETIQRVREAVFAGDEVLDFMKRIGVNSNWDMVFFQFSCQLLDRLEALREDGVAVADWLPETWDADQIRALGHRLAAHGRSGAKDGGADFRSFVRRFASCQGAGDLFAAIRDAFGRLKGPDPWPEAAMRSLWQVGRHTFQEWYLGDEYSGGPKTGKRGFVTREVPLADPASMRRLFTRLREAGVRLGIATGRPDIETRVPLTQLGLLSLFDPFGITTASDVVRAEEQHPGARPLSKPNPFSYLRSYLGAPDAGEVLSRPLPLPREEAAQVLVVGDSVADWMAARAAGFDFAAVLTGLTGQAARSKFEELGCEFILNDLAELERVLLDSVHTDAVR